MKSTYTTIFFVFIFFLFFSCSETDIPLTDQESEEQVDEQGEEASEDEDSNEDNSDTTSATLSVLVFTKTSGFNHRTKAESVAMVEQIGGVLDFDVEVSDNASIFNDQAIVNGFDVIFFTNTSGNTLNSSQQDNVEAYAAQGGNFISNHAASDGYGHSTANTVNGGGKGEWDWYAENVTGCSVRNNPNHTANNFLATVTVENENADLTTQISFPLDDREEWYYWEGGYINSSFTELLRVSDTGSNSFDVARMTAHYWERPDGGVSFYTSMGHARSKYSDEEFVQLMQNVFVFMLE